MYNINYPLVPLTRNCPYSFGSVLTMNSAVPPQKNMRKISSSDRDALRNSPGMSTMSASLTYFSANFGREHCPLYKYFRWICVHWVNPPLFYPAIGALSGLHCVVPFLLHKYNIFQGFVFLFIGYVVWMFLNGRSLVCLCLVINNLASPSRFAQIISVLTWSHMCWRKIR